MRTYQHTQKFSWIWFAFGYALVALVGYAALNNQTESPISLWIVIGVAILLFIIQRARLILYIDKDSIGYRWAPYQKNRVTFSKNQIASLTITRYPFIGYGYRVSAKYGTVNNTRGAIGLWIKSQTGDSYLLGVSDVKEVVEALKDKGYEKIEIRTD